MSEAFICDAVRTPIGRFGGALKSVRADDLGAIPLQALMERNPTVDWAKVDDLVYGCANQAGEDNRNVARMSALLAGLPIDVSATTVNRLCGSGMDAVGQAARAIKSGDAHLMLAGGVEQMTRAPFVQAKAETAFSRQAEMYDTTMGWRFVNAAMKEQYGVESMPETAENVAERYNISRKDQDLFAYRSQQKTARAQSDGSFDKEIVSVSIAQRKKPPVVFSVDEHPRADTSLEVLAGLRAPFRKDGSVTAGTASGINDGACALLFASEQGIKAQSLSPLTRVVAMASAGVEPTVMGMGPVPAVHKVLALAGLSLADMDIIELNEAFAAQSLAVMRELLIADDDSRVNPYGGAISLGHPLGMSGARLVTTASYQLRKSGGRYALCTMCVGVGQGIAMIIERI